ncbi:methyltransferase domain-containing protein [Patescibacteria group bacterium]|nr:methyltransferase domain-containing protein [Patescibacteria group bacterium]
MAGNALLHALQLLEVAHIGPGSRIADFGVGKSGHILFPASRLVGERGKVYGVDLSRENVQTLEGLRRQRLAHNIDLVWADMIEDDLPIPEGSLDAVFIVNTLWTLRGRAKLVRSALRYLRPGGSLVLVDWHPEREHPVAPLSALCIHPDEMVTAAMVAGCDSCHAFTPSPWHWGLRFTSS